MGTKTDSNKTYALDELTSLGLTMEVDIDSPLVVQQLLQKVADLEVKLSDQSETIASLRRDVMSDALTGLCNRRMFDQELKRAIAVANRHNRQGALVFVDLNNFKTVNDSLGHLAGDTVLIHVADILKKYTRPTDVVTRLGGDEFCIIFNDISAEEDAIVRAESLGDILSRTPCMHEGKTLSITASLGVSTFGQGDRYEDVVKRADMDMYAHKALCRYR